jgi:hypothetical protein
MISVMITLQELEDHDACQEGLELFEDIALLQGDETKLHIPEWTLLHTIWLMTTGHEKWLVEEGIVPRANLGGAYLGGANLGGADLGGAYLEGANLGGAYLEGAYLEGAYRLSQDPPIPGWHVTDRLLRRST